MNNSFQMSEVDVPDVRASRISKRRVWLFRGICIAGPAVVLVLVGWFILVRREYIVFDAAGIHFQRPPILLQEPGWEKTGHVYLYDARLGWKNRPGWVAETNGKALSFNSLGLRGPKCTLEKPEKTYRVLALGDSYGWGYGVGDDEVFSAVMQKNSDRLGSKRLEILNASVSGWGTDQQYLYLVNEGVKFQPDLVVLLFFPVNDIENNRNSSQYGMNKPMFSSRALRDPGPVPKPGSSMKVRSYDGDPVKLTLAIIKGIARQCVEIGAELVVVKFGEMLHPGDEAMRQSSLVMGRRIAALGKSVSYIDLDAYYVENGITAHSVLRGNDDGHWNALGHRITAEVLLDYLESNVAPQLDSPME